MRQAAPVLAVVMGLGLAGTAHAGGFAAGIPVEGFVGDWTLSAKGGWTRFVDDQMTRAGLSNGYAAGLEVSWN